MTRFTLVPATLAVLISPPPVAGQNTPAVNSPLSAAAVFTEAALSTGCEPVFVVAEDFAPEDAAVGLSKLALRSAAESRLRAAGIFDPVGDGAYLYINVNLFEILLSDGTNIGVAGSVDVDFARRFPHPLLPDRGVAGRTWHRGTLIVDDHQGVRDFALETVGKFVDDFIDAYLLINNSACD